MVDFGVNILSRISELCFGFVPLVLSPGQPLVNFSILVRGVGLEPTKAYARGS